LQLEESMAAAAVRKEDLRMAVDELEKVLKQDFGVTLAEVARDPRRRTQRLTHAVGVLMKRDYSRLETRRSKNAPRGTERKWVIDPVLAATMPPTAWQMQVLKLAPERKRGESPARLAVRLKRETKLGKAFRDTLHGFICDDPEVRKKIEGALKQAGFGAYAGLASPKGVVSASAAPLAATLAPFLSVLPATAVAIAVIVIATLGLNAICRGSR
jgi:hypothetical protein